MIKFKSDCPEFNVIADSIDERTHLFMASLLKDISSSGDAKHLKPTTAVQIVLARVAQVLKQALDSDLETILFSEAEHFGTEEEREKEVTDVIEETVDICFSIIGDAMPIDIHAQKAISVENTDAVMGFIADLEGKSH